MNNFTVRADGTATATLTEQVIGLPKQSDMDKLIGDLPIYRREDLAELIALVKKIEASSHIATPSWIKAPFTTTRR